MLACGERVFHELKRSRTSDKHIGELVHVGLEFFGQHGHRGSRSIAHDSRVPFLMNRLQSSSNLNTLYTNYTIKSSFESEKMAQIMDI